MDQGILTIHFDQATTQAIKLVSALENISSLRAQLWNLGHMHDQILFYLKDVRVSIFSLINDLNHILSWTSTSYSSSYAVLREHIPSLVRELIAFWDIWVRYLDPQHGFGTIQDDVNSGKIAKSFVLLDTLLHRVKILLVERQLERDFRAHFSDRLAA